VDFFTGYIISRTFPAFVKFKSIFRHPENGFVILQVFQDAWESGEGNREEPF